MKPELLILSGLPASGKSTVAKAWVAEDPDMRIRINYDDMRLARYGAGWKWNRKEENEVQAQARLTTTEAIKAGISVVIDNTNLSSNVRASWTNLGKSLGATVIEQEIDTDVAECVRRDRLRTQGRVGRAVIEMMALRYGFIDFSEVEGEFIICDLDGTICNTDHRLHFIKQNQCPACLGDITRQPCDVCKGSGKTKKNWQAFHAACIDDEPIQPIIRLLGDYFQHYHIIFLTGRDTSVAIQTEDWLEELGIDYLHLLMAQSGDHRKAVEKKAEILEHLPKDRIAYAIDDDPAVIQMFKANGITTLQVGDRAYEQ